MENFKRIQSKQSSITDPRYPATGITQLSYSFLVHLQRAPFPLACPCTIFFFKAEFAYVKMHILL